MEFLQEDDSNAPDLRLPPEVAYMLHSIRFVLNSLLTSRVSRAETVSSDGEINIMF